jgi:hypothetical protein
MIHNEVNCLCHLNVLCQCNESKWAAPSFGTPEKNTDLIHLRLLPTKQMDHLPTLPNAKHSQIILTF